MASLRSLIVLLAIIFPLSIAVDVEYCNKNANYPVKVNGVEIIPIPVVPGQQATFNISANTGGELTKGQLVIDVKYIWFHVHQESHELCTETSCPVSIGDFVLSHKQTLPSFTPPGWYTITMKLIGEDGKQVLTCINFNFNIGFLADM